MAGVSVPVPGPQDGRGDGDAPQQFMVDFPCYSVSMYPFADCEETENGGKIFLPRSALEELTRLNAAFPMLFKLTNLWDSRSTHCGVLEFTADEGRMYIPYWMMRNLMIDQGEMIRVECATLPVANYSKMEPQSVQFLEISNPKAVLECALRNFACLTVGDMIAIQYNDRTYEIRILETRPAEAVNIIECDMEVDITKPIDFAEPTSASKTEDAEPQSALDFDETFVAALDGGHRLCGKNNDGAGSSSTQDENRRGVPDDDSKTGS